MASRSKLAAKERLWTANLVVIGHWPWFLMNSTGSCGRERGCWGAAADLNVFAAAPIASSVTPSASDRPAIGAAPTRSFPSNPRTPSLCTPDSANRFSKLRRAKGPEGDRVAQLLRRRDRVLPGAARLACQDVPRTWLEEHLPDTTRLALSALETQSTRSGE